MLLGGVADCLGRMASPASSYRRQGTGPTQPAGELSVGSHRLVDGQDRQRRRWEIKDSNVCAGLWPIRFMDRLEASDNWIKVALVSWAVFFAAGFAAVVLSGDPRIEAISLVQAWWYGAPRSGLCSYGTSPGRSIQSRICGAIAITRRLTTAATTFSLDCSLAEKAGTTIITPPPPRRDTATNGGNSTWRG